MSLWAPFQNPPMAFCRILSRLLSWFSRGGGRTPSGLPLPGVPPLGSPIATRCAVVGCSANGQWRSGVSLPPFAVPERRRMSQYGRPRYGGAGLDGLRYLVPVPASPRQRLARWHPSPTSGEGKTQRVCRFIMCRHRCRWRKLSNF